MTLKNLFLYFDVRTFSRKKKIHFFINIGVGIIITIFFHFLENTDWGEDIINKAFDSIIKKEAQKSANMAENKEFQSNKISDQIVFIDLTTKTYRNNDQGTSKQWGEPLLTPRDKLAKIVETSYMSGARIIIFDILLESEDCCNPENDKQLRKVLKEMTDKQVPTKVIFVARIGHDGVMKKNLFDDLIRRNPNFHLAIPDIAATVTDRVVRYWRPYEIVRSNNEHSILWNASFLSAMVAHWEIEDLKHLEGKIINSKFAGRFSVIFDNGKRIIISTERDDMYLYRIRFLLIPKDTFDNHPEGNLFMKLYTADQLEHISFNDGIMFFKEKIVVIGNSNPDYGDLHLTAIGSMAGMYIIGNALNTILLGLQPSHSSIYVNVAIEILAIIMAAYCFLYIKAFLAAIISNVILLLTLGTINYYYFLYTGIFLNFTFAVAGIGFYRIISNIEEIIEKRTIKRYD